jgi:uncharacterized membrane protein YdbT with pleckstrin-like domain
MLTEKIQLDTDETVLIQVRKHWFVLAVQLCGVVIIALLPTTLYFMLTQIELIDTAFLDAYTDLLLTLFAAWLLIMWMVLFSVWTNYYLDVWTVTSKRLIAVDQRGLFNRNTGSFRLERLQDINISIRGLLATFLDYGDLQAETASEDRGFVARNVPHPQELKALILTAADHITFNNPNGVVTAAAPQQINDGL